MPRRTEAQESLNLPLVEAGESDSFAGPRDIILLPPGDVMATLRALPHPVTTAILDPWYNKGAGGTREDYDDWLVSVVSATAEVADHIFVWGFPEILCHIVSRFPKPLRLVAWLTWYYKNCPSVIRGWRSSQLACVHLARPRAALYPEHFLNERQLAKQKEGKLRYMPGPSSVIEVPLLVGFVGRSEQCGHPAQKPLKVFEPLVLMTTKEGDTVLDPFCGSGTTGLVCRRLRRRAILCDVSQDYVEMTRQRLGLREPERVGAR